MRSERGDTIIEAVLALAIFAMVTVSMFAIMQRASASAYDSIERTQVRLLIDEQAERLLFIRDQYLVVKGQGGTPTAGTPAYLWNEVRDTIAASAAIPATNSCNSSASNPFYLIPDATSVYKVQTTLASATGLPEPGKGLWIQKVDPAGSVLKRNFHDFYIMACWSTTTNGQQTLSSIVRLYEPN